MMSRSSAVAGTAEPHPPIKSVGGKRQLLPELRKYVPERFNRYFEPFVGGGALFWDLYNNREFNNERYGRFRTAILSDSNDRLIRTYKAIRDDVEKIIEILKVYPHEPEFFEIQRKWSVGGLIDRETDVQVALWFIYLNKTCFNGLYRVNKAGVFNVPFGRYTNPTICDEENLRACSVALRDVGLLASDFGGVLDDAREGDFVYADCPYAPLSATSNFVGYGTEGFGVEDQTRLRDMALALHKRGVHVVLSNSSAPLVKELYGMKPFVLHDVDAKRAVNSDPNKRGKIKEVVITCEA